MKSARGVWGMGHSFGNKLYFTRDIPEGNWVPKNLLAPAKPPTKKAKPPPKSAAQSILVQSGEHVGRVQGEVEQEQEILHRADQGVGLCTLAAL